MTEAGWRGYTEHEFQMALFVRDKIFEHYGILEEDRAAISDAMSLMAIYHLRDQQRIVLKRDLKEIFPGFPRQLPHESEAEEMAREHLQKYDISPPLTELLYTVLLVEITYSLVADERMIWRASPG